MRRSPAVLKSKGACSSFSFPTYLRGVPQYPRFYGRTAARDRNVTYQFEEWHLPKELEAVVGEPKKPKPSPQSADAKP